MREDEICPFSLEFKEGRWKLETLSQDILREIPERIGQNSKPGIDPSMEIALKDLSQNITS